MQRQNEDKEIGLAGAAAMALFAIVFFAGVFISAAITIGCVLAWNREKEFIGHKLTPHTAHVIIVFGWLGTMVLMAIFRAAASGIDYNEQLKQWWVPVLGWVLGTIGSAAYHYFLARHNEKKALEAAQTIAPPPPQVRAANVRTPKAYEYASWDDEDGR